MKLPFLSGRDIGEVSEMSDFETVRKDLTEIVKRELSQTSVVKVNIKEDEDFYNGDPLYRIDIIFGGRLPEPDEINGLLRSTKNHLWDANDGHAPHFTFLTRKDAEDYYDRV